MLVINKIAWSELNFMSHTTPIIFVDKRGIKFKTTQYCVLNIYTTATGCLKKVECSLFIQLIVTVTNLKSIKT